jgi:pimeloyl-ACP methyl ester carboxylesterase
MQPDRVIRRLWRCPPIAPAVFGVSAGGELALAIGLRHPDVYGAVFCASPGAGYRPPRRLLKKPCFD